MTTKPFLDERRLTRALEGQGFELSPTKSGVRVLAPDGGTSSIHRSIFDEGNRVAYANQIGQLVRIGFDLDQVKPPRNGDERWKQERQEVEAMIQTSLDESATASAEETARKAADADLYARLDHVDEKARAIYELVRATPGLHPAEYAERLDDPLVGGREVSHDAKPLRDLGLIETTGATTGTRYWIAGEVGEVPATSKVIRHARGPRATMSANGTPGAGPVRTRQGDPADPVVRFRRMGEKAIKLKSELEDIVVAMVEAYAEQETELVDKRRRLRELEGILGRAVDRI